MRPCGDQITDLCARKGGVAQVMIALDQFVPQSRIPSIIHGTKGEFAQRAGRQRQEGFRIGSRGQPWRGPTVSIASYRWWQNNEAVSVHAKHGHTAGHFLQSTVGFEPIQLGANPTRKFSPVQLEIVAYDPTNPIHLVRGKLPATISKGTIPGIGSSTRSLVHAVMIPKESHCVQGVEQKK